MTNLPQCFDGYCEIHKHPSTKFIETEEELDSFTIWFFRRETEQFTLEEFLNELYPNNFGWDNVTKQFYYKSKDKQIYSVNFTPV